MKRLIILILCLALLICAFILPASAATLDYNDYITDITVSDDQDLIKIKFPGFGMWNLHETNSFSSLNKYTSSSLEFPRYYPLMDASGTANTLLRSDIPDDTSFSFSFTCESQNAPSSGYLNVRQFDKAGNYIGLVTINLSVNVNSHDSVWNVVSTFYMNSIPFDPSCHTFYFDYEFYTFGIPSQLGGGDSVYWYIFKDPSFILHLSMNSLLRQQAITNKQNGLLSAIDDQIKSNGEKLDSIINGTVDPETPSGSDIVEDFDDAETQIRDDASSGLQQGEDVQLSALAILGQYLSAFACVSWIFDKFATIPFFSALLSLSFSLGICGAILSLGFTIASSSAHERRGKYEKPNNKSKR